MPTKRKTITLQDILGHIQALRSNTEEGFRKLSGRIDSLEENVGKQFEKVGRKIDLLSTQISHIDERLDEIEVEKLPKLQTAVFGKH